MDTEDNKSEDQASKQITGKLIAEPRVRRRSPKMENRYLETSPKAELGGIPKELLGESTGIGLFECRYCNQEVKQGSVFQHETDCDKRPKRFNVLNELQKLKEKARLIHGER